MSEYIDQKFVCSFLLVSWHDPEMIMYTLKRKLKELPGTINGIDP